MIYKIRFLLNLIYLSYSLKLKREARPPCIHPDETLFEFVNVRFVSQHWYMNLQAKPTNDSDVRRGGSVPGSVQQTPGGVARNICECLALLCNSDALQTLNR